MIALYIIIGIVTVLLLLTLISSLVCYFKVFYSPKKKELGPDEFDIPKGDPYEKFKDAIIAWQSSMRSMPHEVVETRSYDGLILKGNYYECNPDGPLEILFHGYKGTAERDLSGGIERCFSLGRNALIVSQRGHGESGGKTITFGIKEKYDCLSWIDFASNRFGKDKKIIITGISMGGATVLMAAGENLPENVVCALGDCSYSSPKEIICKIVKEMHLPPKLVYPFIKWGAKIFGKFDLEETSPVQAMATCKVPVLLLHGDTDAFVPFEMSEQIYAACTSQKKLVRVPNAGHGLAYPKDTAAYVAALREFEKECNM